MSYTFNSLSKKVKYILTKYGQDAYLRRRCTYCSQEGDRGKYSDDCEYCGGTGYVQVLQRYTMRKMVVGNQFSFPNALGIKGMGVVISEGTYFFCEGNVNPRYGDIIYDWNNATQEWEIYEINKVLERRYDNRVLFYNCACQIREGAVHD